MNKSTQNFIQNWIKEIGFFLGAKDAYKFIGGSNLVLHFEVEAEKLERKWHDTMKQNIKT